MEEDSYEQEIIKRHQRNMASRGGKSTVAKYGRDHMSMLGKKAAEKRWGKKA